MNQSITSVEGVTRGDEVGKFSFQGGRVCVRGGVGGGDGGRMGGEGVVNNRHMNACTFKKNSDDNKTRQLMEKEGGSWFEHTC